MVKRGDIFMANLSPIIGSEQGGERPVLIIQNDVGNLNSPTTIVIPIPLKAARRNCRRMSSCQVNAALCPEIRLCWQSRCGQLTKPD